MNIKAIFFDFDGVISYGDLARFKFFKNALKKKNIDLSDRLFKQTIGKTTKNLFGSISFFKNLDEDQKDYLLEKYNNLYKNNVVNYLIPIPSTINFIKNFTGSQKLIICSNSDYNIIDDSLKKFGIREKISFIISKDMVSHSKPSPDIYLIALDKAGINSDEALVIEDSRVGVEAALAANLKVNVFLNNYNSKQDFDGFKINSFIDHKGDYKKVFLH